MRSVEAADALQNVDLEELERHDEQRSMEVRVERHEENAKRETDEQISLDQQLPNSVLRLLDVMNTDRQPSDQRSWPNECQKSNNP